MKEEDRQNLQNLRKLNDSLKEIDHQIVQIDGIKDPLNNKQSQPINAQKIQPKDEDQSCAVQGHDHSSHNHGKKSQRNPGQKNYLILIYTVFTCLSQFYLVSQCLNPLIGDNRSKFITYINTFTVTMALWSYYQTIVTDPGVTKLKENEVKPYNLDYKKRCQKCNYWKGLRISHCSTCGKCIYKLDHHCMWTQTCIGYTNQKSFYLFCVYMSIGLMQYWYTTLRAFSILYNTCHFFGEFEIGVYFLWGLTSMSAFIVGMMIFGLTIAHSFYISTNFTTLESMKTKKVCSFPFIQYRQSFLSSQYINIFDRGQLQNLKLIFGSSLLKCWLPTSRQIQNQFLFEPINPIVEQQVIKYPVKESITDLKVRLKGKKVLINAKIVQF